MIEHQQDFASSPDPSNESGPSYSFIHPVAELSAKIMRSADSLSIDESRINEVAAILAKQDVDIPSWNFPPYPTSGSVENLARYMLVLNAINYCYFHRDLNADGSEVRFSTGKDHGSTLAAKRLTEAFESITRSDYLVSLTTEKVEKDLFHADVPIPLAAERAHHLREVGSFLHNLENKGIGLIDFFNRHNNSAFHIAAAIEDHIIGYQDPFMKRSQLFVALLYGRLQSAPDCPIDQASLRQLTQFADYRLPQTKIAQGIIVPGEELAGILERKELMPEDSKLVSELRAATVHSGELLRAQINAQRGNLPEVNAVGLDYLDWKAPRDLRKGSADPQLFIQEFGNYPRVITTAF